MNQFDYTTVVTANTLFSVFKTAKARKNFQDSSILSPTNCKELTKQITQNKPIPMSTSLDLSWQHLCKVNPHITIAAVAALLYNHCFATQTLHIIVCHYMNIIKDSPFCSLFTNVLYCVHSSASLALARSAYIYLKTHHGAPFRIVLSQPIIINDIFAPFCEYRPKTLLRQKYSV